MSSINKMNVNGKDYDVQDRWMPDAIGAAGKILKSNGTSLEFGDALASGGGKLYRHHMYFSSSNSNNFTNVVFTSSKSSAYTIADTDVIQKNIANMPVKLGIGASGAPPVLLIGFVSGSLSSKGYFFVDYASDYGTTVMPGTTTRFDVLNSDTVTEV